MSHSVRQSFVNLHLLVILLCVLIISVGNVLKDIADTGIVKRESLCLTPVFQRELTLL